MENVQIALLGLGTVGTGVRIIESTERRNFP